jgi:hypothetical protein
MKTWKTLFSSNKEDSKSEKELNLQNVSEQSQGTGDEIEQKATENMNENGFKEDTSANFKPRIRGNDYCPCGSNKKFKKCCCLDEKRVNNFKKKYDIRLETNETVKKLKYNDKKGKLKNEN